MSEETHHVGGVIQERKRTSLKVKWLKASNLKDEKASFPKEPKRAIIRFLELLLT